LRPFDLTEKRRGIEKSKCHLAPQFVPARRSHAAFALLPARPTSPLLVSREFWYSRLSTRASSERRASSREIDESASRVAKHAPRVSGGTSTRPIGVNRLIERQQERVSSGARLCGRAGQAERERDGEREREKRQRRASRSSRVA